MNPDTLRFLSEAEDQRELMIAADVLEAHGVDPSLEVNFLLNFLSLGKIHESLQ